MKPDTLLGKLANCLVSFVAGMTLVTLFFWQHLLVDLDSSLEFREFAWAIVVILPGMFCASIIVHELGHLLVALAVEMRIFLFRIGPVAIVREGQRFRLRIRGRSTILGYVLAVPRHVRNLNRRLLLFIAAGPLTNLLVGSALFLIYFLWNEPPSELAHAGIMNPRQVPLMPQTLTSGWVVMAAILNLSVSAHNLIPGKIGGLTTDGGQLANLLRPEDEQCAVRSCSRLSR